MPLIRLALAIAVLLSPGLALAECGDAHEAPPTATVAETPNQPTPVAPCPGDGKGCPESRPTGDRQAVASTIADSDTAPRQ